MNWVQTNVSQICLFYQVATSMLKSGLPQLVICRLVETTCISLAITGFDNQLATSLLKSGNILVVNKLSQAMQTHRDIGLLIIIPLQDVNRLVATCAFLAV